jgi:hypothetical protein
MESSTERRNGMENGRAEFLWEQERITRGIRSTGTDLNQEESSGTTGAIMKADDWKWAQSHFPYIEN